MPQMKKTNAKQHALPLDSIQVERAPSSSDAESEKRVIAVQVSEHSMHWLVVMALLISF